MTDLVRTVRSGIVGLDLALGGGLRFVRRTSIADRESATLLVRGGPGTGKSVLAQDLALRLAAQLGGDVLYVCVEVLPSEVQAQRMGFEGFNPASIVDLADGASRRHEGPGAALALGMRDIAEDESGVPDIGAALLDLARIASDRGCATKVVVVDSLSEGYGLGSSVPRPVVDGVCKLAIEQGWALILVEEVADESVSPWAFAVDTVLTLRVAADPTRDQARRDLLVTKHRFGPCEPGPHRLQIERERVRVIPPFSAYRNASRDLPWPPATKGRSLRIRVEGKAPPDRIFAVPDGVGRCLVMEGAVDLELFEKLSSKVGRLTAGGEEAQGDFVALLLHERHNWRVSVSPSGFKMGTLDQFIDGEEWLEDAVARLIEHQRPVACLRIGPSDRLPAYKNSGSLKQAVSTLAGLADRCGWMVVIFGSAPAAAIQAAILTDFWSVKYAPARDMSSPRRVLVRLGEPLSEIEFTPVLD